MHRLAQLSDAERRRLIQEFVDEVYAGLDADPGMEAMMRSAMPDLPEDPTPEQVGAWVELAELVADPDFRRTIRAMAERAAADRAAGRAPWDGSTGQQLAEKARAALAAGVAADAAAARPWLDDICATAASAAGQADGPSFRAAMRERLRAGTDARAERYWRLLGIINGWPAWPDTVPAFEWVIAALDADAARA